MDRVQQYDLRALFLQTAVHMRIEALVPDTYIRLPPPTEHILDDTESNLRETKGLEEKGGIFSKPNRDKQLDLIKLCHCHIQGSMHQQLHDPECEVDP